METFRVIDLCSGMGGLSYAARDSGLDVWVGVDTSTSALSSFTHNFPTASAILGDISERDTLEQIVREIGAKKTGKEHVLVVSGPPCQGFSNVGSRRVDDPRNEVFVSVAKAIVRLEAKAALIENVSALRKGKNSKILNRFKAVLNNAGYNVYRFELNAVDFGVPQKRRRLIYFILPFSIKKSLISQKLEIYHQPALTVRETLDDLPIPPVRPSNYDPKKNNGSLPNHYAMRHSSKVQNKIASIKPGAGPLSYRKLNPNSYAPTLLSGHRAPPAHYEQPRSITVREALRLQSFPDTFHVMGTFGSQMEQVANAVPALLGKATLSVLVKLLGENQ
jgi:DNA (cytosine-5)-methyltransferase 1